MIGITDLTAMGWSIADIHRFIELRKMYKVNCQVLSDEEIQRTQFYRWLLNGNGEKRNRTA